MRKLDQHWDGPPVHAEGRRLHPLIRPWRVASWRFFWSRAGSAWEIVLLVSRCRRMHGKHPEALTRHGAIRFVNNQSGCLVSAVVALVMVWEAQ